MKKIIAWALTMVMLLASSAALAFDASSEITVISREEGSGTRGAFIELVGIQQKNEEGEKIDHTTVEAVISNSTSVVLAGVAADETAIGYISLGSLNDTVKALNVDGAPATVEAIKAGEYKVARPFNVATFGEISEAAQDFMDFILSAEGQKVIEDNGYIAVTEDAQPYTGTTYGKVVVAGSSSVTPVMEKIKEAYLTVHPEAEIEIQQSDSTTGMQSALDGICDIGMASRELKESELEKGLAPTVIAMDGIAVIVSPENPVDEMSTETIMNIFTGEILTWEEAGAKE